MSIAYYRVQGANKANAPSALVNVPEKSTQHRSPAWLHDDLARIADACQTRDQGFTQQRETFDDPGRRPVRATRLSSPEPRFLQGTSKNAVHGISSYGKEKNAVSAFLHLRSLAVIEDGGTHPCAARAPRFFKAPFW
jgi:hypothetical protein